MEALNATLLDILVRLSPPAVKFVVDSVPLCVDITLLGALIAALSGVLISLFIPKRIFTIFSPAVLNRFRSGVPPPPG
jgi:hypothetical protein